ncbi:YceI family protein [uncultured Jatrophihabitans sp.]|uniref:YceI family protein n=1 Tax=uncultured Jatrophihabitans sp. TaxID=1610747 RepID=UPI0035CBD0B1
MTSLPTSPTLLTSDAAVGRWTLDPARTQVRITHKTFWGLGSVKGVFTEVSGHGEISAEHGVTGAITVAAASIDTNNAKRDKHLRSADFFDAETHPTFVITVHSAAQVGEHLELSSELTARGVREPITLTAEVSNLDTDTLSAHVTGSVDRNRFGISGNQLGMIKDISVLDVDAVFTRATS